MQPSDREPLRTEQPNAWALDALLIGPLQESRRFGSLVLGLLGPTLIALGCCLLLSVASTWLLDSFPKQSGFVRAVNAVVVFLALTAVVVTSLFTAQLMAFSHLPISVRLSMVIVLIVACLSICTSNTKTSVDAYLILFCLPFCLSGFILRRLAFLRAIHWHQQIKKPRITIFWMMDVTSTIAILFALFTAVPAFDYRGLICYLPTTVLFALFGFPLCARMNALSPSKTERESGFGMWMAVNVLVAFLVFLIFVVANNNSPSALIGFIAAPSTIAVAHFTTELQIRWLRGCGWTFIILRKVDRGIEVVESS